MNVIEIFDSIDGEGIFTGCLATFIRLGGCNMRCSYCDTGYALNAENGIGMNVEDVVCEAIKINNPHVTLTGGEPLLNHDALKLVSALCGSGFIVNIETNGYINVKPFQNDSTVITMDYKTISSGENQKMSINRIESLRNCDVLKIVCIESDFDDIERMLRICKVQAHVFLSPVFGKVEPKKLVEFSKHLRDSRAFCGDLRVQVQLHKVIWNPNERGV